MAWKYVMFQHGDTFRVPILFPDKLVHADIAERLFPCMPIPAKTRIVSAGMIEQLYVEGVYGKSETLNINSLEKEDQETINYLTYRHGIIGL